MRRLASWILLAGLSASGLFAVPILRLENSAVGPVSVAVGQNGPQQIVEAYNTGDGQLNLALSASEEWLAPAVGALRPCADRPGNCVPLNVALNTAALTRGTYTGTVTVTDPGATDAPQTITVTIQVGSSIPDEATFYVPPNGAAEELPFETGSELQTNITTQDGGGWLSIVLDGSGTFRFVYPYRLIARNLGGQPEGTYDGTLTIAGSAFPPDNKQVPVTLNVTSEPIVDLVPEEVRMRIAANTFQPQSSVTLVNRGSTGLTINDVQVATDDGGEWLMAENPEGQNFVLLSTDTSMLEPGSYSATLSIDSNAANGPFEVPVSLELEQQTSPVAGYLGAVNNSAWDQPIAQGGIASVFGDQFSYMDPEAGTELPLVHTLGGAQVFVNGIEAPLYYGSYGQVNFQMPYEVVPGQARIQIVRDGQAGNVITVEVAQRAPRLIPLGIGSYGNMVNEDGTFPIPVTNGIPSRPAHPGETLVIYAIGFGQTQPAVASGDPAPAVEPLARVVPTPTVFFGTGFTGGVPAAPIFVGLTPGFVGLYQINVTIPAFVPTGENVPLRIEGPGYVSNTVQLAIE